MCEFSQVFLMILSIVIVLALESFKKPKLEFSIGDFGEIKPDDPLGRTPSKWTHVFVYNKPMPKILSWVWDRSPALGCTGWITFHDLDGQDLFGRKMTIRWANNPEPYILIRKPGHHLDQLIGTKCVLDIYGIFRLVHLIIENTGAWMSCIVLLTTKIAMAGITTHTYIIGRILNGS